MQVLVRASSNDVAAGTCAAKRPAVNRSLPAVLGAVIAAFVLLAVPIASAATPPNGPATPSAKGNGGDSPAGEPPPAPDSPRAAITEFRRLARAGDYQGAAKFLDLSKADPSDGPMLAQHLREVLNRRLWIDSSKLSPDSTGHVGDNQPANREELGTIIAASGKHEPVVLQRKSYQSGQRWVFSAETVAQIEDWYEHLESVWLTERLPRPLLKMGPRLLRWWQWIALVPLLLAAWAISYGVARVARLVAVRALSDKHASSVHQLHGPFTLAVMVGVVYAALPWLGLYQPALQLLHRWCAAFLLVAAFWALWRGVDLSRRTVSASHWASQAGSAHSLLSIGARVAKFVLLAVAVLTILSQLGYQATTLLAGLGIGGVALALAAQKTVENLFGTFSLAVDQPFREGDVIKIDGAEGVVETVGLRSTRIRTADRTVVAIPNGKLADMRVETISRQDKMRFFCLIALTHTKTAQLELLVEKLKALFAAVPLVDQASASARVVALTDAGVNVEASAMLATTNGADFAAAKERLLLGILRSVEEVGARLAHAVRSVEIAPASAVTKPDRANANARC
jgi:MscS family membrane protein